MGVFFDEEVVALGWAKLTSKTGSTHFGVDTEELDAALGAEVARVAETAAAAGEGLATTSRDEVSPTDTEAEAASCTSFLGSALAANVSTVEPTALG